MINYLLKSNNNTIVVYSLGNLLTLLLSLWFRQYCFVVIKQLAFDYLKLGNYHNVIAKSNTFNFKGDTVSRFKFDNGNKHHCYLAGNHW